MLLLIRKKILYVEVIAVNSWNGKKKTVSAINLPTFSLFLSQSVNCCINLFICSLLKPDAYHLGKHFFVLGAEKIILFPERHPKPLCLICVVNRTFCCNFRYSLPLKLAQATHWVNGRPKLSLMSYLSRAFRKKKNPNHSFQQCLGTGIFAWI